MKFLGSAKRKLMIIGDSLYFKVLARSLKESKSVLDLGCGYDSPITKIDRDFYSVGVDIFKKTIQVSKGKKTHSKYIVGNVLEADRLFKPKSFDSSVALDLIEHLTKTEGLSLIKKMEKLSRKNIIIMTPNGFTDQDAYDKNPYQVHKSGWTMDEFKSLGFTVRGLRGLKSIRGDYATIKYRPWALWGIVAFISEYMLYFFPHYSYHLIAIKQLDKKP